LDSKLCCVEIYDIKLLVFLVDEHESQQAGKLKEQFKKLTSYKLFLTITTIKL